MPAPVFVAAFTPEQQRITNAFYLAFVLWREARGEPYEGKVALVYSIMHRVAHPKWWGRDIPSVVTRKWQYSSMTNPSDGQLTLFPVYDLSWEECLQIALNVLDQKVANPAPGADSYYAADTLKPSWANTARFIVRIGKHCFYNTDGDRSDSTKLKP